MKNTKVAQELLRIARDLVSMEFDSEEEKKKYKQEHKVRPGTKLTVKKKEKGKVEQEEKPAHDEWFHHPFSKDRTLYHGTSKKNWEKIQKDGHLTPHEADDREDGASVWFTSDVENARQYSKRGGVILGIKHGDAMQHKHHRYSPISSFVLKYLKDRGASKDEIYEAMHDFDFVVHEKIPLSKVKVMNFDKG